METVTRTGIALTIAHLGTTGRSRGGAVAVKAEALGRLIARWVEAAA